MKKLGAVLLRYLTIFLSLIALVLVFGILLALPLKDSQVGQSVDLSQIIRHLPLLTAPLATIFAGIFCCYTLTRLFATRLWGYCLVSLLNWLFLAGAFAICHWLLPNFSYTEIGNLPVGILTSFPGYASSLVFFESIQHIAWPIALASLTAPAVLLAACWPLTRLTRSRPLFGAFLGPAAVLGYIYLLSIYSSPGVELIFQMIGLSLPLYLRTVVLCLLTLPALFLFDLVFAYKPQGSPAKRVKNA